MASRHKTLIEKLQRCRVLPYPPAVTAPSLKVFCEPDKMGITVVSQQINPHQAVPNYKIARRGEFCQLYDVQDVTRGTRLHRLAHLPYGSRPTILNLRVPYQGCAAYKKAWRQNTEHIAKPCEKMTPETILRALWLVVVDYLSISSVAATIGVTWHVANDVISELGLEVLINNPARLEGIRIIGMDEHV